MNLAIVYKLHTKYTFAQKLPASNVSTPALSPSVKTSTNSSGPSVTEAIPLPQLNNTNMTNNTNAINTSNNSIHHEVNHLLQQQELVRIQPM